MSTKDNVDLSKFSVTIARPIWLGGRIWEPGVHKKPDKILIKAALENHEQENAPIYFSQDGRKVNPYSKYTMVDLNTENEDDDPSGKSICPKCAHEWVVPEGTLSEDVVCPNCGYAGEDDDNVDVVEDDEDDLVDDDESDDQDNSGSEDEDESDEDEAEVTDFGFVDNETFAAYNKEKQREYVDTIRVTPDAYAEHPDAYEAALFTAATGYLTVVTGKNAKKLLEELLAEYDN